MTLHDNQSWDRLIYGLIYPGFLGSMLYEFVPAGPSDFTWGHFLTVNTAIRFAILIFYFLDYLHLYGDMDALIRDPNKKSPSYFVVDVLTCFGYLAAFIALKIPRYWPTYILFALVPWLFLFYKRKNLHDKNFLKPYGYVTGLILCYRGLCNLIPELTLLKDQTLVLIFVCGNVLAYGIYVFWFYEKSSRRYDEEVVYR